MTDLNKLKIGLKHHTEARILNKPKIEQKYHIEAETHH